jgi:hypothetical protein
MRLLILPFLFITTIGLAQVSMDEFLWSALEAPAIKAFDNQNVFLESNPYRLSMIRRMEFRTESNQLDPERQDFALRVNPANPWELKRNNQYFQTYQEVLQLDRERELKELLKTRYEAIINWVYLEEIKKLKEEEQTITQNLIRILEAQRFSDFFNANDYVELKIDQVEKIVELEELYFSEDNQRNRIESLFPTAKNQPLAWSFADLISIDAIGQLITEEQTSSTGEVAYREKRINLAEAEWALEKSNINIGFVQAQYQQFRVEQDRSPWSIGLGVTLPFFNPNKGDMAKRKLEVMEAEGDLADAKDEQLAGQELMKARVQTLTARYHNIKNQMDSLNVDALASTLQEIKDSNPLVVMRLKRSLVKSKNSTARLRKEIYLAYVEFLWYSEKLQQQPLKNYLGTE